MIRRASLLLVALAGVIRPAASAAPLAATTTSCFLLDEIGGGQVRRDPSQLCTTRVPPASTFKIPHAIAALDSGVVSGPDVVFRYDGSPQPNEAWRRDHTLATAMRYSVVWYFQRVAQQLGMDRERAYLRTLDYGNADPSSGLTTFWLGGSLRVSPEEEKAFLIRLFTDRLPVRAAAMKVVRAILVQPQGTIVNALGEHPFDAPWPAGTVVSAKTGSTSFDGDHGVRWLVGHVARSGRAWVFVSCVTGSRDLDQSAAVDLAAQRLRDEGVLGRR